jgi:hypothetical protein
MMTDEELDNLIKDMSGQLKQLTDDPERKLTKQERKDKYLLAAKIAAVEKIKAAREKGNLNQEIRASMDYNLLVEYGHKNPLLFNYIRSQTRWFGF